MLNQLNRRQLQCLRYRVTYIHCQAQSIQVTTSDIRSPCLVLNLILNQITIAELRELSRNIKMHVSLKVLFAMPFSHLWNIHNGTRVDL